MLRLRAAYNTLLAAMVVAGIVGLISMQLFRFGVSNVKVKDRLGGVVKDFCRL